VSGFGPSRTASRFPLLRLVLFPSLLLLLPSFWMCEREFAYRAVSYRQVVIPELLLYKELRRDKLVPSILCTLGISELPQGNKGKDI
jgi:hypothetical protein